MTLLLLGPHHAVVTAVAGAWTQCYYRATEPAPLHRTLFSMSTTAITMAASGMVYVALGGEFAPTQVANLARPLVGAIGTYFMVNTTLIAGAVGMATRRTMWETWRRDFLWSGASFMVAGTAGAVAAIVIARGEHWKAALIMAPVYLAYRTYEVFVGRLDDERRHTEEAGLLHQQTMTALRQAHAAERELAAEKERLARTIKEMTQLQKVRDDLLVRERTARAHAEDASRIKDQFLAAVSHELRTPLSAILGWADMLRRDVLEQNSRGRAAQTIYQSARRQSQLIDDLLDVARITSGKLRLERAAIDLRDPIQDAIQVVQPGAEAKGLRMVGRYRLGQRSRSRRRGPHAADRLEPAVERGEVHAGRRGGPRRPRTFDDRRGTAGDGLRTGNQRRLPAACIRRLPPGGRDHHPCSAGTRTGIVDRQEPRGSAWRNDHGAQRRTAPGSNVPGAVPDSNRDGSLGACHHGAVRLG